MFIWKHFSDICHCGERGRFKNLQCKFKCKFCDCTSTGISTTLAVAHIFGHSVVTSVTKCADSTKQEMSLHLLSGRKQQKSYHKIENKLFSSSTTCISKKVQFHCTVHHNTSRNCTNFSSICQEICLNLSIKLHCIILEILCITTIQFLAQLQPALGMSLRKISDEAFVFSVFWRNQEKMKPLTWWSVSSDALQLL